MIIATSESGESKQEAQTNSSQTKAPISGSTINCVGNSENECDVSAAD